MRGLRAPMSVVEALERAGEPLSPAVREALVMLCARVRLLEEENALLRRRIAELEPLEDLVAKLQAHVRELEARLGLDSTNSSKPPSSDPPHRKPKRSKRPRSGRKRGAQPGHRGAHRTLYSPERVDQVVEHRPATCRHCRTSLDGAPEVGAPGRHQVIDLPPVRAHITEHRTVTRVCPACRRRTRAELPSELRGRHFGPRLVAFSAMLMSRFRMSRRQLTVFLGDLLDVEAPALGTTQAFVHEAADALLAPYREIRRAVRRTAVAHADETGWWLRDLRRWLWVAVSKRAALFRLARRRSAAGARALLGRAFGGLLVTDRYAAYNGQPDARRQFCWAHLVRSFQALADRGTEGARVGELALQECSRLFAAHRRYCAGTLTHAELARELAPVRARFWRLLQRGAASNDGKARKLSRSLLRRWDCLWTFLRHEGVPPTNNAAERALRGAVIHRKLSFGSKSGQGMRFLERIFSVNETCRMNHIDILDYLTRTIVAHRAGAPAPRLLPTR